MKKKWIFAVVLLLLAALAVTAHADGPVNPYREGALRIERRILEERKAARSGAVSDNYSGPDYIRITGGSKKPCQQLSFQAKLDNTGYTADDLCFKWWVLDTGRNDGFLFDNNYDIGTDTFSYYFYSAGTYYVKYYAFPKEYENSEYWTLFVAVDGYIEFTIPEDGVHPTLEQKAQEIVNQCKGPTQWDTALNLYEWLTANCDYDYEYHRYGADIIFSGSGVCDAFSKAYMLLLNTAGIPANRAFGPNHAWNVLQLGGKWYQADPTWDDLGTHQFFCLSAKAMIPIPSHSENNAQQGDHVTECTSMDANYFIHTGKWKNFGDWQYDEQTYTYHWVSCTDQVRAELAKGNTSFSVGFWKQVEGEYSSGAFSYPSITSAVVEAGLQGEELLYGSDRVQLRTEADSNTTVTVLISGWDIRETGTLTLPKSLKAVANESYAGTGATTLVIPSGCTSIGAGAFRNSQVRKAFIPNSVTSISDTAFEGCGKIILITENETAVSYAQKHGMLVVRP